MPPLIRPYKGSYSVSQVFANNWPGVEPNDYLTPRHTVEFTYHPGDVAGSFHDGEDDGLPLDTQVVAAAAGVIEYAKACPLNPPGDPWFGFGEVTVIRHDALGLRTLYAHQDRIDVTVGQTVSQGQPIGLSGSTGHSSGPHLHFSVLDVTTGEWLDPEPLFGPAKEPPKPAPPAIKPDAAGIYWMPKPFTVTLRGDGSAVRAFDCPSDRGVTLLTYDGAAKDTLTCDAWARGKAEIDPTTGRLDGRFFHLATPGGWIKSSRVNGNPAGSTP